MKRIKDLRTRALGTHGIQQESSVEDAVREFLTTDVSALVVYNGKKLVGIFTKNHLVRCVGDHPNEILVEKGFRHVPGLEGDEVVGMVTSSDILLHQKSHLGGERNELVRYIQGG